MRRAVCWARAIQLTDERANTLRLEDPDYGQEAHFRQAHNNIATTKQKDDVSISGTSWLVELPFGRLVRPDRLGKTTGEALFRRDNIYHVAATVKLNLHSEISQVADENQAWRAVPASAYPETHSQSIRRFRGSEEQLHREEVLDG